MAVNSFDPEDRLGDALVFALRAPAGPVDEVIEVAETTLFAFGWGDEQLLVGFRQ